MFRALLPIAIIPGLFVALIIQHFGLTLDSVLVIVMLAQFYIIWVQVEASLRQAKLNEQVYEPILLTELNRISNNSSAPLLEIKLKNVGKYPAYNVFTHIYVPPFHGLEGTTKILGSIDYNYEKTIYTLDQKKFNKYSEIGLEIHYTNVLGKDSGLTFTFPQKSVYPSLIIHGRTEVPGILLNSVENLRLLFGLLTMNRRMKKLQSLI